jgi:hypothetical protein
VRADPGTVAIVRQGALIVCEADINAFTRQQFDQGVKPTSVETLRNVESDGF